MMEESTAVDAHTFRYVAERTTGEDSFLAELKEAARVLGRLGAGIRVGIHGREGLRSTPVSV